MEEELVIPELALRMKKLDYDKPCFAYYQGHYNPLTMEYSFELKFPSDINQTKSQKSMTYILGQSTILAPTWQSAFAWFREKYKIHHRIDIQDLSENLYDYEILEVLDGFNDTHSGSSFKSYQEAQTACLKKIIKIAEKK